MANRIWEFTAPGKNAVRIEGNDTRYLSGNGDNGNPTVRIDSEKGSSFVVMVPGSTLIVSDNEEQSA